MADAFLLSGMKVFALCFLWGGCVIFCITFFIRMLGSRSFFTMFMVE